MYRMHFFFKRIRLCILLFVTTLPLLLMAFHTSQSQDWFSIGINLGAQKIKMAVPGFPASSVDPNLVNLTQEFNQALWNDLDQSGIFDLVSKSYYPLTPPVSPRRWTLKRGARPRSLPRCFPSGRPKSLILIWS